MSDVCRSCGAEIVWALTEKGKRMPLDAEPVENGNVIVSAAGIARVVGDHPALDIPEDAPRYVSHFVTCPFAAQHRRRR